ncbi:unnamed protein product, partial [Arabidopsis halleri]
FQAGGKDGVVCRDRSGFRSEELGLFCWWKLQHKRFEQRLNRREGRRGSPKPSDNEH